MGFSIALDDFGTGHSSLAYLRALPVDAIKIDKSFVRALPDEREGTEIVRAIIALAHSIGRRTHAEGVENEAQLTWLLDAGCDFFQGYYIAMPLPADDLFRWHSQVRLLS